MQGPGGSNSLQTFWEPLLNFYKVAQWVCETDLKTKNIACICGGGGEQKRHDLKLIIPVAVMTISASVDLMRLCLLRASVIKYHSKNMLCIFTNEHSHCTSWCCLKTTLWQFN